MKDIDELTGESYLQSGDVDARVAYLLSTSRPRFSDDELQDRQAELDELMAFREEVSGYAGTARWSNGMSLIQDSAWGDFAEDEAESLLSDLEPEYKVSPLELIAEEETA